MFVYRHKLYTAVQFGLDLASFWPIWECGERLRVYLNPVMARQLASPQELPAWVPSLLLVALLWAVVSWRLRLFRIPREISVWRVMVWAAENTMSVCALTVVATYFSRQLGAGASRSFVICILPATFLFFSGTRFLALAVVAFLQRRSRVPRIAVVGDPNQATSLVASLESRLAGLIRGIIVPEAGWVPAAAGHSIPVLGTTRQIAELVNREQIDRAIIVNHSLSDSEVEHCRKVFWRMGLPVSYALDLPQELKHRNDGPRVHPRLELSRQYGLPTVEVAPVMLSKGEDAAKRVFDLVLGGFLLVLLTPVLLVIAVLTRLTAGSGPVFERRLHVGKGGRHFNCFEFRTTDATGRRTSFGRFLRRSRADELPQLGNILRGRMSFVGPAPLPVGLLEGVAVHPEPSWAERRTLVQPGLTGLWQTGAEACSFDQMLDLDLEYVDRRSFLTDLGILLDTPGPVLRGVRVPECPVSAAAGSVRW